MATFALLSDKLVGQNGEQVSRDSLKGKYVFLYFSAHWCGPCRQFTPKLVELYKKLKADPVTADKFEIVFVSSDKSSQEFDGYFKEMPWLAVPFADQQAKKKLSSKLKVKGIPSLALFNTDGTVAANNVRSAVMQDPQGKNFPWLPKSAMEILSQGTFKRNDGKDVPFTELSANQYIGLYFSAHWCPPCRQFTPKLISTYTKLKQAGKSFEIVFVSRDQEEDDYNGYFGTMPWVSLPMGDALIDELAGTFQISGIPSLIILKSDGTVVNDDACGAVGADADGANFPWEKKPMGIVSQLIPEDDVMEALNAQVCVVLSTRGVPNDVAAQARAAFTEAAQAFHDEVNSTLDQEERVVFLTAEHEGLYDRILEVSKAQEVKGKVNLVAFNIQAGAKNVVSGVQTKTDILNFAKNFHKSQLE